MWFFQDVTPRLDRIEKKIDHLTALVKAQGEKMASDLAGLTAQVQANTDVEASAITLLNGLAAQIATLKNDPVAIQALADQLKTSATSLAAAITANTPPA